MCYYKNFDEPGYYWGGFIDLDKPWQFIPYDYYRNARKDKFNTDLPASFLNTKSGSQIMENSRSRVCRDCSGAKHW